MRPFPLALGFLVLGALLLFGRRLTRTLTIVALVFAISALLYGSGVVELPSFEETVKRIGPTLGRWTYLIVGGMAFLETGAFVGLIAPGELTIVLGGFVAGQGRIDLRVLIPLAWAAAVAGDVTSYALGRRLGRDFLLRHGPKVMLTAAHLERVEQFFAAHGGKAIVLGRFVGVVRALAPFMAGAARMRIGRFLAFDVASAGVWSTSFVLLGYLAWQSFDRATSLARSAKLALTLVLLIVATAIIAYRYWRSPDSRRRARERLRRLWLRGR